MEQWKDEPDVAPSPRQIYSAEEGGGVARTAEPGDGSAWHIPHLTLVKGFHPCAMSLFHKNERVLGKKRCDGGTSTKVWCCRSRNDCGSGVGFRGLLRRGCR
jgi:hypothetical protein